jgi:hypothetical protein
MNEPVSSISGFDDAAVLGRLQTHASSIIAVEASETETSIADAPIVPEEPAAAVPGKQIADFVAEPFFEHEREIVTNRALLPNEDLDADLLPVFLEEGNDILPQMGLLLRAWQHKHFYGCCTPSKAVHGWQVRWDSASTCMKSRRG